MRILMALDESPYAEAVTRMIAAQMKTGDAEVRVLHVVEPYPMKLAEAKGTRELPDLDAARAEQRERAKHLLENAATILRSAGFNATWIVQEGDPRTAILDDADAWAADLVVVGSHGGGGLQRWLMGSVSEAVARHAACSVQIVRIRGAR